MRKRVIIGGIIVLLLCGGFLIFLNHQESRVLEEAKKEVEYQNRYAAFLEQYNIDSQDPKKFNLKRDDCLEWGEKHFTKSIHDVNYIECPWIIQESYVNDNDYSCKVCIAWN